MYENPLGVVLNEVSGFACVEQWGRTVILVQASLSRLGENSISSPRFLLEHSPRRGDEFLSDKPARSGETTSPKRELAQFSRNLCCSLA